ITTGRRKAAKGAYNLSRTNFDSGLDERLALWIPPREPRLAIGAWLKQSFSGRCWIAVALHRRAHDVQRLGPLREASRSLDVPLAAAGRAHRHPLQMHCRTGRIAPVSKRRTAFAPS